VREDEKYKEGQKRSKKSIVTTQKVTMEEWLGYNEEKPGGRFRTSVQSAMSESGKWGKRIEESPQKVMRNS